MVVNIAVGKKSVGKLKMTKQQKQQFVNSQKNTDWGQNVIIKTNDKRGDKKSNR